MRTLLRGWHLRHRTRLWLALRMIISAVAAYSLAEALRLPQGYWAVLTTIIITQNSVGSSLKAAMDRLIGSVCGALVGALAAFLLPSHSPTALGIALFAAVAPLALLTAYKPDFRIAPVTAIIVLMSSGAATHGPLGYAFDRVLEITLGAVVGLVVSGLVAPARAHLHVREAAAETARLLAEIMAALAQAMHTGASDIGTLATRVQAALNRLGTAVEDAARERRSRISDHPDPDPLFRTLRRLQQDALALRRLFDVPWPESVQPALALPFAAYAEEVAAALRTLAAALVSRQLPPDLPTPRNVLAGYMAAIDTARREGLIRELPTDTAGRILGTAFRAEQLQRDLDDLTERTREMAAFGR